MNVVFSALAGVQAILCAFLLAHVALQLRLARSYLRRPRKGRWAETPPSGGRKTVPFVTIQLPVHNERQVIERLIDGVAALDWPRDRLEIQVLDDSTDATVALAAARVAHHRAAGLDIKHLRRSSRAEFKAGALRHGLSLAKGDLIAIFDADFVPDTDFLRLTVPHFADPRIGMVQTRWSHANLDDSLLTRVQGLMLDTHLTVEQAGRAGQNCFLDFDGTAGIWRAAAIRDSGDWSGDTLSEDLDLSYRAQLRGWRFHYIDAPAARGDLPGDLRAFRARQYRRIKGGAQCARRLLPGVLAAPLGWNVKLQAAAHLLETSLYLVFLALVVLTVPMAALSHVEIHAAWTVPILLFALGMGALVFVCAAPRREMIRSPGGAKSFLALWSALIVVSAGLVVHNGLAALSGLLGRKGAFVRTPKPGTENSAGQSPGSASLPKGLGRIFALEAALWAYLGTGLAVSVSNGTPYFMLAPVVAFFGLSYLLALCVRDAARQWSRAMRPRRLPGVNGDHGDNARAAPRRG